MLRIGSSQSDITPTIPFLMGGTFRILQCEEVLDPLMASCVVADDGRTRVAMVSCDLGQVPRDMTLSIRELVHSATETPRENIHLMATHNHSAPTVFPIEELPFHEDAEAVKAHQTVRANLVESIAACVIEAHKRLVPARMGYGRGRFEGGAYNRRFIMGSGRSKMYGGGDLELLKAEGPVDPEVQTVWFEDFHGNHLAVIVNYASHVAILYGVPTASADFPGAMRGVLQGVLGDDVPVLYLQGACGNVAPMNTEKPSCPRGIELIRRVGRGLAGEALRIMSDHFADAEDVSILTCGRMLEIPYREPAMSFEEASRKWKHYSSRWEEFLRLDIEERSALCGTLRLQKFMQASAVGEAEIAAFALGDVYFVTNQAELFVEYQLDIKERFKDRRVIVSELTNGRIGYVPTRLACALGGYETHGTRFGPGAGELIRDASCDLIERLIAEGNAVGNSKRMSSRACV